MLSDTHSGRLTPETLIRWRAAMTEQGVGDPTIRKAMAIVQSILARAVEWLRIPSNPAREVRKPPRAVRPLAPLEIERIRALLPTQRDRALVALIGYAGLRPEEALALQSNAPVFMDGDRVTPGTEKCQCGPKCEFPCWQRLGLTETPCCPGCPPLSD